MEDHKALHDQKTFDNFNLHLRSKLKPKKKAKDTQLYKLQKEYERNVRLCQLDLQSTEESQQTTERTDDGTFSMRSHSGRPISSLIDSRSEDNESCSTLPSKMWWVPPIQGPTPYRPPSVMTTSRSYSLLSSATSKPRSFRSSEDLKREVFTQCVLIEAEAKYEKYLRHAQKTMDPSEPKESIGSINAPPVSKRSTDYSQSRMLIDDEAMFSTRSLPNLKLLKKMSKAPFPRAFDERAHVRSGIDKDIETTSHKKLLVSKGVQADSSSKSFSDEGCQSELIISPNMNATFTIGDVARKHIISPITSQVAKICTQQVQLILEVVTNLEKSCEEFEQVCQHGRFQKKN